jgi:hypothetical protein
MDMFWQEERPIHEVRVRRTHEGQPHLVAAKTGKTCLISHGSPKNYCNFPLTLVDTMSKEAVMILPMKDIIPAIVAKKRNYSSRTENQSNRVCISESKEGVKRFPFPSWDLC